MPLDSEQVDKVVGLINDSFRVRRNQDPVYVDVGGNLRRISSNQHQVIFGRRGSGKSCLLVHFLRNSKKNNSYPIYILADEFKRLTYPDVLIRLLIEILEAIPVRFRTYKKFVRRTIQTEDHAKELRKLLDLADESDVTEEVKRTKAQKLSAGAKQDQLNAAVSSVSEDSHGTKTSFRQKKLDFLERHLKDYKSAIVAETKHLSDAHIPVLIDDFYLFPRDRQADVIDYLHRLLRDTNLILKIATIRHRTSLIRNSPQTVGVEIGQDIEEISLDRTLENLEATQDFLHEMLESMARRVKVQNVDEFFNPDAFQALTLVSGGVPRDFLTIFVKAVDAARAAGNTRWLTPTFVYKGAGRVTYNQKIQNLKVDAGVDVNGIERVFVDLLGFCLKESRKTAFLISQDESQAHPIEHDIIQQLMDFKLIHVVEPDTSAASGRPGRYEAYTLDFSLFMEPRRRNIEIVEFWKIDEQRRRVGIREAPVYPLSRLGDVLRNQSAISNPSEILEETEDNDEAE